MSRKMSDRWLAANKENAKKSTGPKTPEGMAKSAQNARSHGIPAKEVVVSSGDGRESAAEFERLIESLHAQSPSQDAIEHLLIDRVAACYWRLRRAQRFEVGAVREGLDDCKTPLEGPGPNMRKHEATVLRWRGVLDIKRQCHEESLKRSGRSSGDRRTAMAQNAAANELDRQADDDSGPALSSPVTGEFEDRFAKAEEALSEYESLTEIAEMQDAQADSRRPFLAALPGDEPLNRLIRYETMLDRQLHRALSELRRRRTSTRCCVEDPSIHAACVAKPSPDEPDA